MVDENSKCPCCGSDLDEVGPYGFPVFDCGTSFDFDGQPDQSDDCREIQIEALAEVAELHAQF